MAKKRSPAQQAVIDYGQRLYSTGSTYQLEKVFSQLGRHKEAQAVRDLVMHMRMLARELYKADRLRIDPNWKESKNV